MKLQETPTRWEDPKRFSPGTNKEKRTVRVKSKICCKRRLG
jgi:hypothetical protein